MSLNDKIGGYPVEWFVQTPSEHFTCGICFDVLKNPHQCKNGHTFCYSCVSKALESHSKCPTCKIALNFESLGVNLQLRNLIDLLVVKCSHDDGGCEWTGSLECSLRHFRTCSMRCIPCPLHAHHVCTDKKCSGRIKRKDVHNHLSGGPKRNVNDSMLIMAETIAYQKKQIDLLHEFIVSGKVETHALGQSIFVGSFDEDDKKEGFGFIKHPDGTTYSGHFHKGQYAGFGVSRSNQCVKAGEWENGHLNGHCMVRRPHTEGEMLQNCSAIDTNVGEWHNNRMHGFGRRVFAGVTYVGPFENGMKQGEFTRVCANDNIVECTYENSVMSTTTTSTLTLLNGQKYVGTVDESFHFKEGKFSSFDGTV